MDTSARFGVRLPPHVSFEVVDGERVAVLREPATGSTVTLVPGIGSNVSKFQTVISGRSVEVLAEPPDMATLRELPTRWGSGVLFPYPGRVSGDSFTFGGDFVRLRPDPATGTAMHGVVRRRPWRVLSAGASHRGGAWVRTALNSRVDRISPDEWPYPFQISLTVRLLGGRLRTEIAIDNKGGSVMPFGLGFHPYFPTPFGRSGSQELCEVEIPADERWIDLAHPPARVTAIEADEWPRVGKQIGQIEVTSRTAHGESRNHWFFFRTTRNEQTTRFLGRVVDQANDVEIRVFSSSEFKAAVFYTPPGLLTASIEPHTCMPNAFNLHGTVENDPGLDTIAPGERWTAWYEIVPSPTEKSKSQIRVAAE